MIEVELTEEEMNRCWDHAKEIVEYYDKRNGRGGSGAYGHMAEGGHKPQAKTP